MNINLLIKDDFTKFLSQTQIDNLIEKLTYDYGFTPLVFHQLPNNLENNYFLLFTLLPITLPQDSASRIILMTSERAAFLEVISQHKFALIVEWIRYIKDFPLFCGNIKIVEKMKLKCIRKYTEDYCLIRNNNKSDLLKAIVDYLKIYDELIQNYKNIP